MWRGETAFTNRFILCPGIGSDLIFVPILFCVHLMGLPNKKGGGGFATVSAVNRLRAMISVDGWHWLRPQICWTNGARTLHHGPEVPETFSHSTLDRSEPSLNNSRRATRAPREREREEKRKQSTQIIHLSKWIENETRHTHTNHFNPQTKR